MQHIGVQAEPNGRPSYLTAAGAITAMQTKLPMQVQLNNVLLGCQTAPSWAACTKHYLSVTITMASPVTSTNLGSTPA